MNHAKPLKFFLGIIRLLTGSEMSKNDIKAALKNARWRFSMLS
jgi:hypothetical protein